MKYISNKHQGDKQGIRRNHRLITKTDNTPEKREINGLVANA